MTVYRVIILGIYLSGCVVAHSNIYGFPSALRTARYGRLDLTYSGIDSSVLSRRTNSPPRDKHPSIPAISASKVPPVKASRATRTTNISTPSPAADVADTKRKSQKATSAAIFSDPQTRNKRQKLHTPAVQAQGLSEASSRSLDKVASGKQNSSAWKPQRAETLGQSPGKNDPKVGRRPLEGGASPHSEFRGRAGFFGGGLDRAAAQASGQPVGNLKRLPFSVQQFDLTSNPRVLAYAELEGPGIMRTYGTQQGTEIVHVPVGKKLSTNVVDRSKAAIQAEMHENKKYPSTGRTMRIETTGPSHVYTAQPGFFPELNRKVANIGGPTMTSSLRNVPGDTHQWSFPKTADDRILDAGVEHKGATGSITGLVSFDSIEDPNKSSQQWNPLPSSIDHIVPKRAKSSLAELVPQHAQGRRGQESARGTAPLHGSAQLTGLNTLTTDSILSSPRPSAGDSSGRPAERVTQSLAEGIQPPGRLPGWV